MTQIHYRQCPHSHEMKLLLNFNDCSFCQIIKDARTPTPRALARATERIQNELGYGPDTARALLDAVLEDLGLETTSSIS